LGATALIAMVRWHLGVILVIIAGGMIGLVYSAIRSALIP
jgi:hypothetical protein